MFVRHYKGNYYEVLGEATHTETLEPMVIYRALYGEHKIWARPKEMFCGLTADGRKRFEEVPPAEDAFEEYKRSIDQRTE